MVSVLEKLGVISVCILGIHFARIMTDYFYKKSMAKYYREKKLKELGKWGVVLGADKRVGQAYAVELAKQGLNIVLIGKNLTKLSNLSNLLEKYFQVLTGVFSLSFTSNEIMYVENALGILDIAILINAPDYAEGLSQPEYFLKIPHFDLALSTVINRNLALVTKMCAIVLPGMVSKGKGIIVNVSSVISKTPCPLLALHGASAAYVEKLSEELRNEYSSTGVIIQTLLPGYIVPSRSGTTAKSWLMPSPRDYVGSAVRRLGIQGCTIGYTPHSIIHGILIKVQRLCPDATTSVIRRLMESVRVKGKSELSVS